MPALALKTAQFPLELRTVVPTIVLGILFGFVLARSRYGELFALLMTLLYGVIVVVALAGLNEPTNPVNGVYDVFSRTTQWLYDAFTGGINQDDTIFPFGYAVMWRRGLSFVQTAWGLPFRCRLSCLWV
jgi:hypothetical protein